MNAMRFLIQADGPVQSTSYGRLCISVIGTNVLCTHIGDHSNYVANIYVYEQEKMLQTRRIL